MPSNNFTHDGCDFMHLTQHDLCKALMAIIESPRFNTTHEKMVMCQKLASVNGWVLGREDRTDFAFGVLNHQGDRHIWIDVWKKYLRAERLKEEACTCCGKPESHWINTRGYGTCSTVIAEFEDRINPIT